MANPLQKLMQKNTRRGQMQNLMQGLTDLDFDLEAFSPKELEDSLDTLTRFLFAGSSGKDAANKSALDLEFEENLRLIRGDKDKISPAGFKAQMQSGFDKAMTLKELERDFRSLNAKNAKSTLDNRPRYLASNDGADTIESILAPLVDMDEDQLGKEAWMQTSRMPNSVPLAGIVDNPELSQAFSPALTYHRGRNKALVGGPRINHTDENAKIHVNFTSGYQTPSATFMSGRSDLPSGVFGEQLHPMLPFRDLEMLDLSDYGGMKKVFDTYDEADINNIFQPEKRIESAQQLFDYVNEYVDKDISILRLPHHSFADRMTELIDDGNAFDGIYTSESRKAFSEQIPGDTFAIFDMDNVHQPFADMPKAIKQELEWRGLSLEDLALKHFPQTNYEQAYGHMSDVFRKKGTD